MVVVGTDVRISPLLVAFLPKTIKLLETVVISIFLEELHPKVVVK